MFVFKKLFFVVGVVMIFFNNVFVDEGYGIVKFKGEVIFVLCFIKSGDEDLIVNLGEVVDIVLKSDQKFLVEFFIIYLQDCMLSQGGIIYLKVKVIFIIVNIMMGQFDFLKNIKEIEIGGVIGVGVCILDSQSGEVILGILVVIMFNNINSYQELNFKVCMEFLSKDVILGNVYVQVDYKIVYE